MIGNKQKTVSVSAPGKVIILGEHFVVHGAHALAAAIEKRVRVTVGEEEKGRDSNGREMRLADAAQRFPVIRAVAKKVCEKYGNDQRKVTIRVSSDIPPGSGLGSSAALSVAATAALGHYFGHRMTNSEILDIASFGEGKVHGNPSGIDTAVSLLGGVVLFNKKTGTRPVSIDKPVRFLVVYSGVQRRTSELVAKVSRKRRMFPNMFSLLSDDSSRASIEAAEDLEDGNLGELGALMNEGQIRLSWVGASSPEIDSLIERVHRGKLCYGAKLTGAGGGGSIIALPKEGKSTAMLKDVSKEYRFSFLTSIPQMGLIID